MYTSCVRERYLFKKKRRRVSTMNFMNEILFFLRISGNLYLNSELSLHAYKFNSPNWGYLNSKKLELKKKCSIKSSSKRIYMYRMELKMMYERKRFPRRENYRTLFLRSIENFDPRTARLAADLIKSRNPRKRSTVPRQRTGDDRDHLLPASRRINSFMVDARFARPVQTALCRSIN